MILSVRVSFWRLTNTHMGHKEIEQKALQVIPCIRFPERLVTMAMPVANRDMTFLNSSPFTSHPTLDVLPMQEPFDSSGLPAFFEAK
jgi:hypothetical protein